MPIYIGSTELATNKLIAGSAQIKAYLGNTQVYPVSAEELVSAPTIAGITYNGGTMTATPGTWQDVSSVTGEWYVNGIPTGETGLTFAGTTATEGAIVTYVETADETMTATSNALHQWVPSDVTAAAWYDASDATTIVSSSNRVAQWNDKSGNNRHLQNTDSSLQPLYVETNVNFNNLGSIDFSGNKGLTALFTDTLAYNVTVIRNPAASTFTNFHAMYDSVSLEARMGGLRDSNGVGFWSDVYPTSVWCNGEALPRSRYNANVASVGSGTNRWPVAITTTQIVGIITNPGRTSVGNTNGTPGVTSLPGVSVGNYDNGDKGGCAIQSEIILLNYIPDSSDRQKIEGYLAHKWGLTAGLDVAHPYKTAPPAI